MLLIGSSGRKSSVAATLFRNVTWSEKHNVTRIPVLNRLEQRKKKEEEKGGGEKVGRGHVA